LLADRGKGFENVIKIFTIRGLKHHACSPTPVKTGCSQGKIETLRRLARELYALEFKALPMVTRHAKGI